MLLDIVTHSQNILKVTRVANRDRLETTEAHLFRLETVRTEERKRERER